MLYVHGKVPASEAAARWTEPMLLATQSRGILQDRHEDGLSA